MHAPNMQATPSTGVKSAVTHTWVHEPETNAACGLPKRAKFCDNCGKIDVFIGKKYDNACRDRASEATD